MFIRKGFVTNSSSTSYYFCRYSDNKEKGLDYDFLTEVGLESEDEYEHPRKEIFEYVRKNAKRVYCNEVDELFYGCLRRLNDPEFLNPTNDFAAITVKHYAERLVTFAELKRQSDDGMLIYFIEAVSDGDDEISRDLRCNSNVECGDTWGECFLTVDNS